MHEIKLYKSPWKALKLIVLCLPFVAISLYDISYHALILPAWLDWICLCFFGLGIPLGVFNLLDPRPELIISEAGIFSRSSYSIFDKAIDKGLIRWDSIKDAYLRVYKNSYRGLPLSKQKMICLTTDKSRKKSKLSNSLGFGNFNIPLINLKGIDEEELISFIKAMAEANICTKQELLKNYKL